MKNITNDSQNTFLQGSRLTKKGPSGFLTSLSHHTREVEKEKIFFSSARSGRKIILQTRNSRARGAEKREREERNKKRLEVVEARVLRLYSIIDPKRNGRRRRRGRRKRRKGEK